MTSQIHAAAQLCYTREMTRKLSNEKYVELLVNEYERISSDICIIESTDDKVVGFGLTLVAAGFAYGVQQNIVEMFFFLPIALVGIMLYAILQYHNMFWFGWVQACN
jgi:hypothetical protein